MSTDDNHSNPDAPLWGASEIARVIRRTNRETYYLIKQNRLDVTQVGSLYVSTARRVLASIGVTI